MANNNSNKGDFPLPQTGYLVFDSLGMKAALKQRLTDGRIFSDQIYEGSNLSQIIDVLAFTFNGLIYYANRTSTESTYSDTQLYENINRVTKLIGYNPIGQQTSVLSFTCSALAAMPQNIYTIPRYSYINLGSIAYTFNDDVTFYKNLNSQDELLEDVSNSQLFYQGRFVEYPAYTATGEENEIVHLLPGDNVIVDHFNINVYVKDINSGTWSQWERVPALYLATSTEKKFEVRLNENKHYEIKFGNNINGQKLNTDDIVAIYYLKSNGSQGEVGVNTLQTGKLTIFSTTQYQEIYTDLTVDQAPTIIPSDQLTNLVFDNSSSSTYYTPEESVDSIRNNAPNIFRSQYRLVTDTDFENYVKTNYSNIIHDVKVVNNWSYLSNYLKYFYDMGITNPNNISRALYNQVQFADSCNFNNVYMFMVPKVATNALNQMTFLSPSLKSLIITSMQDIKLLTCEPIAIDPIYMGVDIGLPKTDYVDITDVNNTELYILQKTNSKRDTSAIQDEIANIFTEYLSRNNSSLGQTVDLEYLNNAILAVNGVDKFYTRRTDDNSIIYEGLSLIVWNPIYLGDQKHITQNMVLSYFMFPFLNNVETFKNKITVQNTFTQYQGVEY